MTGDRERAGLDDSGDELLTINGHTAPYRWWERRATVLEQAGNHPTKEQLREATRLANEQLQREGSGYVPGAR